ncbi:MAG: N-acetyltransferase family protein [Pseudobdellovibrionaceae bacterium]
MGSISVDPQPAVEIELVREQLIAADLNDLCDATDAAIQNGGGFGWVEKPSRDILERYWQGVITMPSRLLFVARLDQVICGTAQLVLPPKNNEAQSFSAQLTSHFVSPWARGHGIAGRMLSVIEDQAKKEKVEVINLDIRETQEAAIRLYEGAGYVQLGRHPYYAKVDGEVIPGRYYYKLLA